MKRQLIANRIKSEDGTILWSKYAHDFVEHTDKISGKTISLDGGRSYQRVGYEEGAKYEDCSVYLDDDYELVREFFLWGTYGKTGKDEFKLVALRDLETSHIKNILLDCWNIKDTYVDDLMTQELIYREEVLA